MEKPVLSPQFTIEDIHKLREYNYYLIKDMTTQEKVAYYNERGRAFLRKKGIIGEVSNVEVCTPNFADAAPAEDAAITKAICKVEGGECVLHNEID